MQPVELTMFFCRDQPTSRACVSPSMRRRRDAAARGSCAALGIFRRHGACR